MVEAFPKTSLPISVVSLFAVLASTGVCRDNWPNHRGPKGNYHLRTTTEYPKQWSVATGDNIRWRAPLPETGHSGIAVWGDKLFLT